MQLHIAKQIAEQLVQQLAPWCDAIAIAGSIRREVREVKDIEIVCIPKRKQIQPVTSTDLFTTKPTVVASYKPIAIEGFCKVVNRWKKVKGEPIGRYTQRSIFRPELGYSIKLDLFMCYPDNAGLIFFIRTGSADYCKRMMGIANNKGYPVHDGYLWHNGVTVPCETEKKFFRLINVKYIDPKYRN